MRVKDLIDAGAAYRVDDDWYFDVTSDPRFGQVGHYDAATERELFAERGETPTGPVSGIRLTAFFGVPRAKGSRLGSPLLAQGDLVGTSNVAIALTTLA